jgi:hypothetical protein
MVMVPSIEPILITREGLSGVAFFFNKGVKLRVNKKTPFTFKFNTLSHACAGYSAKGAPQLFLINTRMNE